MLMLTRYHLKLATRTMSLVLKCNFMVVICLSIGSLSYYIIKSVYFPSGEVHSSGVQ